MKRVFASLAAVGILLFWPTAAIAASDFFFVLPRTDLTEKECIDFLEDFEQAWYGDGGNFYDVNFSLQSDYSGRDVSVSTSGGKLDDVLGCAIKTGDIHLDYIPFYIKGIVEFLLALAGLLSVVFIVIGGYKVLVSGLIEDKESGKNTIIHAIAGLILCFLAWGIVNIVQYLLTS